MYRLGKNRLLSLDGGFRRNSLYAFWFLHRIITKDIVFITYKPCTIECVL